MYHISVVQQACYSRTVLPTNKPARTVTSLNSMVFFILSSIFHSVSLVLVFSPRSIKIRLFVFIDRHLKSSKVYLRSFESYFFFTDLPLVALTCLACYPTSDFVGIFLILLGLFLSALWHHCILIWFLAYLHYSSISSTLMDWKFIVLFKFWIFYLTT